jgi:uncharacterized protein YaaN involved in tellurite resistance
MDSEGERLVKAVMDVNLADPVSRARARQAAESLASDHVTEAKSRMLARRFRALVEADAGGAQIAEDLERLAARLRQLDPHYTGKSGALRRLFKRKEDRTQRFVAAREDFKTITDSLSRSSAVLRQNSVALEAFEVDAAAEARQVAASIERADALSATLSASIRDAKLAAEKADVVSFAEREVLIPLEEHRQHLQSLRAVNQQMLFSLAMLRETNAALIQNIQQITLATRGILAATSLRTTPDGPASEDLSLNDSLEELSRALDAHTAWRKENLAKRSEALQELQNLSSEAFGSSDYVS